MTRILAALAMLSLAAIPHPSQPASATSTPRRPIEARDLDGGRHRVPDSGAAATVLLFIAHDCPNANRILPEFQRLHAAYVPRGVRFFTVYAEPGLSSEEARRHRNEYAVSVPALIEPWRVLAAATGVTVSPEAAVLGPDGTLLYRGRIDDRFVELGRKRPRPTKHDLEDAVRAILNRQPVPVPRTRAVGCFLATP